MSWGALLNSNSSLRKVLGLSGLAISATWGSVSFSGVRTELKKQDVNTDAGLVDGRYTFSILCDIGQFSNGNYPQGRRDKVTILSKVYRVLSTKIDSISATIRLDLGDINQ